MTTKLRAASFQDGAVTTAKIAADAITNVKISDDAVQTENIASTVNLGRRNIIYNGAMKVAQRGTSSTGIGASSGFFTLDRYKISVNGTAGRLTMSQVAITDLPGFANALKLDCTTADTSIAASEFLLLHQDFEGQDVQQMKKGTSDAEQVTVSFYVKGNASATYVVELFDNDNNRSISQSFSVTTSWNRVILSFPADTTGTFDDDNATSLRMFFWLHAGSTYAGGSLGTTWHTTEANRAAGISSFFDSTDRELFVTGLQMEVGSQATPFEHRSFGEELALCQRYFTDCGKFFTQGYGYGTGNDGAGGPVMFPTTMRSAPTIAQANGNDGGSDTAYVINFISNECCSPEGVNNGNGQSIYYFVDITASAEL